MNLGKPTQIEKYEYHTFKIYAAEVGRAIGAYWSSDLMIVITYKNGKYDSHRECNPDSRVTTDRLSLLINRLIANEVERFEASLLEQIKI